MFLLFLSCVMTIRTPLYSYLRSYAPSESVFLVDVYLASSLVNSWFRVVKGNAIRKRNHSSPVINCLSINNYNIYCLTYHHTFINHLRCRWMAVVRRLNTRQLNSTAWRWLLLPGQALSAHPDKNHHQSSSWSTLPAWICLSFAHRMECRIAGMPVEHHWFWTAEPCTNTHHIHHHHDVSHPQSLRN